MGKRRGTGDKAYVTHTKFYQEAAPLHDLVVVENVPQYSPDLVRENLGPSWCVEAVTIDPRQFGIPAARTRTYMIAYKTDRLSWRKGITMQDVIQTLSAKVRAKADVFWWRKLPQSVLTPAQVF